MCDRPERLPHGKGNMRGPGEFGNLLNRRGTPVAILKSRPIWEASEESPRGVLDAEDSRSAGFFTSFVEQLLPPWSTPREQLRGVRPDYSPPDT